MSVSFGFSKKIETKKLVNSEISEKGETEKPKEYVTALDDREVQRLVYTSFINE